jgi:pyridoxal phosphate enzyme (YggS family)
MSIAEAQSKHETRVPVTLIAVSKGRPVEAIVAAIQCGQTVFGENRVKEGAEKFAFLRSLYPQLQLHLIGQLQSNKVKMAVANFDVIQTLDRPKLAEELGQEMTRQSRFLPCYIEVNIGMEPQKAGVSPEVLEDFYGYCTSACGLNVTGLMSIPPREDDPAKHFLSLAALRERLNLPHLSMGMSSDFPKAVALGATHVRVGTAIFGGQQAT